MLMEQPPSLRYWYIWQNVGGNDIKKEGVQYLVEIPMKKLHSLNMCML